MASKNRWLRILLALPLGVLVLVVFHAVMALLLPRLYASALDNDMDRSLMWVLIMLAGSIASLAVGAIGRHRLWLVIGLFLVVMLGLDLHAVLYPLADQPRWFKAAMLLGVPLQAWIGALLAARLFHAKDTSPASGR